MLDGIDQFIINSCIRKIPFEKIMTAIGYSEEKFNNRIEELRNKGINIYPGMEGKKLFGPDIQLYNLLEQNLGIEEIEEKMGLKRTSIMIRMDKLRAVGLNVDFNEPEKDEEKNRGKISRIEERKNESKRKDNLIHTMYENGSTKTEIAAVLNISHQAVECRIRKMKKNGIVFTKPVSPAEIIEKKVLAEINKGLSVDEISEVLNLSAGEVKRGVQRLRNHGVIFKLKRRPTKKKAFHMDEINEQIVELRKNGKTVVQISKIIGISIDAISKRIRKMKNNNINVEKINVDAELIKKRDEQILSLYSQGYAPKKIAGIVHVSVSGVNNILLRTGARSNLSLPKEKIERIKELRKAGKKFEDIAKELNISAYIVRRVVFYGVKEQKNEEKNIEKSENIRNAIKTGTVNIEVIRKAINGFMESKQPTNEQLEEIAKYFGIDLEEVLMISNLLEK